MPPIERDADLSLRHQHSASSDHGRALIPMWDSSDPERAPPPLPLHPQSPSVGTSRAGTSTAIQSAHAALTEKARESGFVSTALAKRMSEISPEKPSRKDSSHRRMQSLQTGTVRDLSLMLEGRDSTCSTPRSPEKSTRPSTPCKNRDPFVDPKTDERNDNRAIVLSPVPGPSLTPIIRPTVRRPHQTSILGENTPPQSATMLALQNMSTPTPSHRDLDPPLSNVTNGSTALIKAPQSLDALSHQIISLTSIATSLQKEMSQLSRRSRDNATDLVSLKEATNARDEDIRKSLRELITNMNDTTTRSSTRDQHGGSLLLENKPHAAPSLSKSVRPFSLPRIPSPNSFAASYDRESATTPSLYGADAPGTIAMLEKILRDMGTREGQELLLGRLSEVIERLAGMATAEKLEELFRDIKANQNQSVVPARSSGDRNGPGRPRKFSFDDPSALEIEYDRPGPMSQRVERLLQDTDSRRSSAPSPRAADLINEDILKIIRTVKDSVAQGGGLTAEVKALVRELRGEVLGMGREIGRRLDEVEAKSSDQTETATKVEMTKVVEEGLAEMKQHMNHLLREHRRQSAASVASKATTIDYQEVYNAMRAALKDSNASNKSRDPELSRDDVIRAVREAWEMYKPEIEVQQIGLERDEVLECLKEGLREYAPQETSQGATRDEVFTAVIEGLKHFVPPQVDTPATLSRDEILEAVRECLEEFEFPVAPSAISAEITKEDMVEAVKQGLTGLDLPSNSSALVPIQPNNDEVFARLRDIMEFLREEFNAVSIEAKQNVAANGRDTEQVLDATKDGFDRLRADIEGAITRAAGVNNQDEFMEGLIRTLDVFRDEIAGLISTAATSSKDALRGELETLRDTVNTSMVPMAAPAPVVADNRKVLEALQDGINSLRSEICNRSVTGTTEILDAVQEGLNDLRSSIDKLGNKPTDLTANDEILDALKSGLNGVRSEIDTLRSESQAVAVANVENAVVPAEILKHDDIKNLEVLITQLRIKVEAMESQPPEPEADPIPKVDFTEMENMLRGIQESVAGISNREPAATDAASREDVQAIETILRNTKSRLDDLIDGEQAVRKDHIDTLETLILETRESLGNLSTQLEGLSSREDINMVESLVAQVANGFEEMKERHDKQLEDPERLTKTDVDAVEAVCLDVKSVVEQMVKADIAALPTKEDLKKLEELVQEFRERIDTHASSNEKAFEERQAETVGVSERVTEVKTFLEDFQTLMRDKLTEGVVGLESLEKLLGSLGETVDSTIGADLKEMFETMKSEFEESRAGVVGAKLDTDEKFQQTTETIASKIDERIDELMTKYDDFQLIMDERAKAGEARDVDMEAAVVGTKAVADELKTLIDTLGSTVTDSLEKMEEASKAVFNRVEEMAAKSEEQHSDHKAEHQLTRDQVKETLGVVEGVQGHIVEYQPKILETIKDVLLIVGQHYEHSKSSITTIQEKIEEAKPEPPLLPPIEKYDDTNVHEKLDKLVDHTHVAGKAFTQLAQLDTLDKVHQQVQKTAADINEFIAAQTQRIADDHEDREKTLQDTTIALERRLAETEQVELNLAALREEEERLKLSIVGLRADQGNLTRQKTRLTADVSSLETALRLRREELHEMETRAEGLERRILEGVMDHSRILLMSKNAKDRDVMSRKRVPPSQKPAAAQSASSLDNSKPRAALNMAMSRNRNAIPPNPAGASRRILSLSQINHNVSSGGFKRSQSVRTPAGAGALRKTSWGGRVPLKGGGGGGSDLDRDKENAPLKESDEDEEDDEETQDYHTPKEDEMSLVDSLVDPSDVDAASEAGTLRRSSLGTSIVTGMTETEAGYSEDDLASEWTESQVGTNSLAPSSVGGEDGGNEVVLYEG